MTADKTFKKLSNLLEAYFGVVQCFSAVPFWLVIAVTLLPIVALMVALAILNIIFNSWDA